MGNLKTTFFHFSCQVYIEISHTLKYYEKLQNKEKGISTKYVRTF